MIFFLIANVLQPFGLFSWYNGLNALPVFFYLDIFIFSVLNGLPYMVNPYLNAVYIPTVYIECQPKVKFTALEP